MSRAPRIFRVLTLQRVALALVMAAFVMRGLTPAGYMFDRAQDGGFVVRMCGGSTPDLVDFNLLIGETSPADAGDHGGKDAPARKDMDCPYALTATLLAPAPLLAPQPVLHEAPSRFVFLGASSYRPAAVVAPLPARGPPLSA